MINAAGGNQCVDLASFTIGVTPEGFEQAIALPVDFEGRYTLLVDGIGSGEVQLAL